MFSYNDFIGPETISREYKEFSLHKTGLPYEITQAERYCETNQFDFHDLVMTNLEKYIQYIPKYVCGFWNSKLEGEIFIGTDDYGYVKGIPIQKSINKEWLIHLINETISTSIQTQDGKSIDIPFTLEIHSVEKPEKKYGWHPQYSFYKEKKTEFLREYHSFLETYQEWKQTYEIVNMKLVDIVNNDEYRNILIDFIKKQPNSNQSVLEQLYNPEFKLMSLSGDEIKDLKTDDSNIFYWVTVFKDALTVQYKKEKPYFLNKFKYRNIPYTLLISFSEMIPYWVDQIELVLIQIKFNIPESNYANLQYYNGQQWIRCNRTMDIYKQPVCMPQ